MPLHRAGCRRTLDLAAVRLLAGRHDELAAHRVQTVTRLLASSAPSPSPKFPLINV